MTRGLQSSLEASGIECSVLRNNIPFMAHVIQLAFSEFMGSLSVMVHTKSCRAHERNQHFGENETSDIGKSQTLRKERNATIDELLALSPGLSKIIVKLRISRYFESTETNLYIAQNACDIDYTNTWSPKRVH
jgi:hypothetical protein